MCNIILKEVRTNKERVLTQTEFIAEFSGQVSAQLVNMNCISSIIINDAVLGKLLARKEPNYDI